MEACSGYVTDVHHVGSTAIPGIAAKPVIDIMGLLRRHEDGFACVSAMAALGYKFGGEAGVSGRHYFVKGEPRTHHVHMYSRITRKSGATPVFATTCGSIPQRRLLTRR